MNRRQFLLASTGMAAAGAGAYLFYHARTPAAPISGGIVGPSVQTGHLLRDGGIPAPAYERRVPVVIVGGGIAGLSAAWKLQRAGFLDFELLELEPEVGGNALSGANHVTPYPWGAHYLPQPTPESKAVRELLEDLGVIEGYTEAGAPVYQERMLCFAPQERLFLHGTWQAGVLPSVGVTRRDLAQYARFRDLIEGYAAYRTTDGRKGFTVPMAQSSRDPRLLALDRLSMREFLLQHDLDSAPLHWYVDYACRDDYGCRAADVSAWAGVHYFASREGRAMTDTPVLTWPEGNGWIVKQLHRRLKDRLTTQALVFRMENRPSGAAVDVYHPQERRSVRILAEAVICACPSYLIPYLMPDLPDAVRALFRTFEYAPWMVANMTLSAFPHEQPGGMPVCWDNVIYESDALGYVVATHQSVRTHREATVFTYYRPLSGPDPAQERGRLLNTGWHAWVGAILRDLSRPHPDIAGLAQHIDIFRWGHAMVRPRPGFLWGAARRHAAAPHGSILFAHSSLSGFSLFEEAQYWGVTAAERILARYGIPFTSSV